MTKKVKDKSSLKAEKNEHKTISEQDEDCKEKAQDSIRKLCQRATELGLQPEEIKALFQPTTEQDKQFTKILKAKLLYRRLILITIGIFKSKKVRFSLFFAFLSWFFYIPYEGSNVEWAREIIEAKCILEMPGYLTEVFRPHVPCGVCKNLTEVPVVYNITNEDFTNLYAYTGIPVLIKGAIDNWTALETFNFEYFKKIYTESEEALDYVDENCQFFKYQTEFETLGEVFDMSENRSMLMEGTKPWYIGWSNCDHDAYDVGKELRSHYSRPYFLPEHSSNMATDWLFMGGPGFGAGLHIDVVDRPSWQAQILGSKTWLLEPSPECWSQCQRMEVTVEKGDIIVLDTNIWYHSTRVNPGNVSITIGAEYD